MAEPPGTIEPSTDTGPGPPSGVVDGEAPHRSASPDWQPGVSPAVLLSVALGGVVGAVGRYLVETALPPRAGAVPWATLLVNVTGSAALGLVYVVLTERLARHRLAKPFIGTGIIGAYTTFSTFSEETVELVRTGHAAVGAAYLLGSVVAGLTAVVLGIAAGRRLVTSARGGALRGTRR
jgi:fluoride exporter